MLMSSLDLHVFSGLVVASRDPAGLWLTFENQRWMVSVMEVKTSLSYHVYCPGFTLPNILRLLKIVEILFM
jgi:hypothetical protein